MKSRHPGKNDRRESGNGMRGDLKTRDYKAVAFGAPISSVFTSLTIRDISELAYANGLLLSAVPE